ncbi:MAG: polysaccharide biosynthesis tyrosine autokinase [Pseudomonadota bacterium]
MSSATREHFAESPEFAPEDAVTDDSIDLREYAKILRKYRWPILLCTALVTAITAYVVSGMTPVYRATSTLLIETQQTMPMSIDELVGIDTSNREYYQTQFEVLKSRKLAKRVIEEMGIAKHPELHNPNDALIGQDAAQARSHESAGSGISIPMEADPVELQIAVNRFLSRLNITPIRNTKLAKISFESSDPVFAAQVANKIADTYIVSYLDSRMEMGEKATDWLGQRLTELKLKLEESQHQLLTYREQHGLVDIQGSVGKLTEQEIGIITGKLIDAKAKMAEAEILYREVEATRSKGTTALLGLPIIDSNEMVRRFKVDAQGAQLNLNELANRYGDKHPKVIDARSRLNTAQANLRSQINNIVDSIEKGYQIASQTVASLESNLKEGKQAIQQVGRSEIELLHLEREVELNQKMYDTFYTRIREVDEAEDMTTTNAQISEYAEAPLGPVKPRKALIVLISLLLSLFASTALAFLLESMNDTITSTEDVEKTLKLKMLGIIPLLSKSSLANEGKGALVPGTLNDRESFEESIKTVRTSVSLEEVENQHQVIMVTSALPGEGKSTLASHLAYSLSQLQSVLLIECDLRRPSLHRSFEFPDSVGLAQLLNGEARFGECLKQNVFDNLDVIPAGKIPRNPLELISSPRFTHLLEKMKSRYDRIIIDSAPVQAVSDALLLGRLSNTVLYAVRADSTPAHISARGAKRLRDADIDIIGAVVTQVNIRKIKSYGGDLDYQGYYDYYGYTDDDTNLLGKIARRGSRSKATTEHEEAA